MKISVVIPLYNKALHIKRAIDSILNQTHQVEEIIVVDDGSTDDGCSIIEDNFSDSRIRIIKQENMGQSAARNKGVREASNELVAFLDADDEWLPNFLLTIRRLVNNFPDCGAYATSFSTIHPDGTRTSRSIPSCPPPPWIGIIPNFFKLYQDSMAFFPSSIVIPKSILEQVGGFPVGVHYTSDIDCWVRIAIKFPIAFCPSRVVIYHQDASNRTAPTHSSLDEKPVVITIKKAIQSGDISPGPLRDEALEYVAQQQIYTAISNIMAGNSQRGKEILRSVNYTKRYKNNWLIWRFWTLFPAFVLGKLLSVKRFIRGFKIKGKP